MIADLCIHDSGDGNPHAHIMLTMRAIDNNGHWMDKSKKVYILDANGQRQYDKNKMTYKCVKERTTNWDSKEFLEESKAKLADYINAALKKTVSISKSITKAMKNRDLTKCL